MVFFIVLALFAVFDVFIFNQLVTLKHNVGKAWSNIDIPLKQRHDELPKLVETCKQYMQFEQKTLEKVMQARITGLENAIADRREFYNDSVNVNNVRVEQFPDTIVARLFGFRQFPLLRFAAEEKKDVDLKQLFNR